MLTACSRVRRAWPQLRSRSARRPIAALAGAARRTDRRTQGMDQSRGAQLVVASDVVAGRAEPGAGRAVDDHVLRPHRGRVEPAASGDRHPKLAADASHHDAVAVPHAADHDARLETGVRRRRVALHATPDRGRAGMERGRGAGSPFHEQADREHAQHGRRVALYELSAAIIPSRPATTTCHCRRCCRPSCSAS